MHTRLYAWNTVQSTKIAHLPCNIHTLTGTAILNTVYGYKNQFIIYTLNLTWRPMILFTYFIFYNTLNTVNGWDVINSFLTFLLMTCYVQKALKYDNRIIITISYIIMILKNQGSRLIWRHYVIMHIISLKLKYRLIFFNSKDKTHFLSCLHGLAMCLITKCTTYRKVLTFLTHNQYELVLEGVR